MTFSSRRPELPWSPAQLHQALSEPAAGGMRPVPPWAEGLDAQQLRQYFGIGNGMCVESEPLDRRNRLLVMPVQGIPQLTAAGPGISHRPWQTEPRSWRPVDLSSPRIGSQAGTLVQMASHLKDGINVSKLLHDFGLAGSYYLKGDKIIFRGYAGMRRHLSAPRFLQSNPRVVAFGLGRVGRQMLIQNGFFSVLITGAGLALDAALARVLHDERLMAEVNARWVTDLGKSAVASLAATAAALAVGAAVKIVFLPLATSLFVGIAVGGLLDYLDNEPALCSQLARACQGSSAVP